MIWIAAAFGFLLLCGSALIRWGGRWGSTCGERDRGMPGDDYLTDGPRAPVAMTRAVSIQAPPDRVWPWLAQLGRGAGFYSLDWLDNGRKASARHIVSWIPAPQLGDATAIGYLRLIEPGRELAWWADGAPFMGCRTRLVSAYRVEAAAPTGSRLVSRMSADASGFLAPLALLVFRIIDSVMATRQLLGLRQRIERLESEPEATPDPETGERDQYQDYEVLFAAGDSAGTPGKEHADRWHRAAIESGLLAEGT